MQVSHDKSERELHKQNDEQHQGNSEAMEIDLKCAEKVTDSDVESNADDKVGTGCLVAERYNHSKAVSQT